ncbi:hypothetical protein Alches_22200 [Alicyclobacillus hesperidum subsp. aegles]|uniref:hypothetical protein n=1 Tax=Alicyclobacillus hesperidum TaxID=89784 RepID=UPI002229E690|nr:hypothetical protein [Alicyclobacillus hesperidum]GLG02179.1 hypothetical protein Alches_22200 [Alicyclobacillus hesperidum subsp. aegles]
MIETIKDYLVSLGFAVDQSSYEKASKAIENAGEMLTGFGSQAIRMFGQASAAVAAFGVAAATGMAKFLGGLGNQEIQMEILSRQLWTTQQQAMAFNATLKAMGASLQELYLSPTLMSQYQQLHSVAEEMQTPADYQQQIRMVQDLQLQFKQLRLETYYALQWIGYYFIKYMSGPITNVTNVLQSINSVIVKNMPTWTKQVAQVMVSFVQAGEYIVQALGSVWHWLQQLAQYVPGWAKAIGAALAVLAISNPFFRMITAISILILLFDDFETYLHGGKAMFGSFWQKLIDFFDKLSKSGNGLKALKDTVLGLITAILGARVLRGVIPIVNMVKGAFAALFAIFEADPIVAALTLIGVALAAFGTRLVLTSNKGKQTQGVLQDLRSAFSWLNQEVDKAETFFEKLYVRFQQNGTIKSMTSAIKGLFNAFADLGGALVSVLSGIGDLFGKLTNSSNKSGLQNFFQLIADMATGAIKLIAGTIEELGSLVQIVGDALQGKWGVAWDVIQNMWTGQNLANAGIISQSSVAGAKKPLYGPPSYPYMFQNTPTVTTKHITVNANQTNHIHGTSAQATAHAVTRSYNRNLHNLRGVIS